MAKSSTTPYSFVSGFVQDCDTVIVTAQIDELVEAGEPDSEIMRWTRDDGEWVSFDVEWSATRVCVVPKPSQVVATGPDGQVAVRDASGLNEEVIDPSGEGTTALGVIRDLRLIGNRVYCAGMARQIYRREGKNKWSRRDQGVLQPPSTDEVKGFNSIDGLKEDDIYAVGFEGEIWHYRTKKWHQIDSPTNVILNAVRVVRKNLVFICGQNGTLLRGHRDKWEAIEHDATEDQFWDLEWFNDTLYLATHDTLFRLLPDDSLEALDLKLKKEVTFGSLHANDGILLSVGGKNVCWTDDAKRWHDVTP